ncbi:hypothetical protein ACQEVC_21495 [Plantactinospora sp. CA-294935]|uniref:hypothetical protein n=1 Tax=Plantactinospora sp. CA-294935 TaxID=3240012 RepID=UPI003D8E60C5
MTEEGGRRLLRSAATPQWATFLELLLDLVFVFAPTRISARLIADFTCDQRGVLAGLDARRSYGEPVEGPAPPV